jgi:8-oxo-dGTP pyrophosphatase MutT (NUDIX family)
MTETASLPIVEARPAATTLIVRDHPFEVLMVKRRQSSFYASAVVFPGGLVEAEDASDDWAPFVDGADALQPPERALRIAACREAYEETGVLIGSRAAPAQTRSTFVDTVIANNCRLPLADLVPFGHWITPLGVKKRFDTHFYLCAAPNGAEPRCDGDETVRLEWVRPLDAIARAAARQQPLLFPQLANMRLLAEYGSVASAMAASRRRMVVTVTPLLERRDGRVVIVIPEAAGYGISEFTDPDLANFAN